MEQKTVTFNNKDLETLQSECIKYGINLSQYIRLKLFHPEMFVENKMEVVA